MDCLGPTRFSGFIPFSQKSLISRKAKKLVKVCLHYCKAVQILLQFDEFFTVFDCIRSFKKLASLAFTKFECNFVIGWVRQKQNFALNKTPKIFSVLHDSRPVKSFIR